jgi:phage terminase large subunit
MAQTLTIKTPRWFKPFLKPSRYKGAHGGRGCVHPDTPIDVPGGQIAIKDFKGGLVWSWHDGKKVLAFATPASPFTLEQLYEVGFADGRSIIVTDQHKFLTHRGWRELQHLDASDAVFSLPQKCAACHPRTTADIFQTELLADDPHCLQTHADCQGDYSEYCRQCDQPLLSAANGDPASAPSPIDGPQHNIHALCHADDSACDDIRIPSLVSRLLPSPCVHAGAAALCFEGEESYSDEISFEPPLASCRSDLLSRKKTSLAPLIQQQASPPADCDSQLDLAKSLQTLFGKHRGIDHGGSYETPVVGEFILNRIAFVRKHSRQIYWDLHVFGTNNYLSNGIVNHNSGKSHAFAEAIIEAHVMDPKRRTVCVREIQKSLAQSVKRLLELKIEQLGVESYFEVQESQIKSRHGDGLIIFQGMQNHTSDSIKSLEGYDCAWVEEAQSLSQRSLDLLRPTIRKPDSELWFTWNPNQTSDPVDVLLRGIDPPPSSIVREVNFQDNPWFPDVLKAEMEYDRARDPDKYKHVWLGGYVSNSEARVFRNWRIEEFETPADATHRFGADWGFASDPTVLIRCHVIGRTIYVDHEAYRVGCEIMDTPDLFLTVPESEKWPIVADSARPETISHMQKNGFPKIMPAIKGPKSVEEGVEWLKSHDIVVHPRCKHTIDELTCYSYKTDPLTGLILPVLADRDNHLIDALRYACEASRRAAPKKAVEVKPLATMNRW